MNELYYWYIFDVNIRCSFYYYHHHISGQYQVIAVPFLRL